MKINNKIFCKSSFILIYNNNLNLACRESHVGWCLAFQRLCALLYLCGHSNARDLVAPTLSSFRSRSSFIPAKPAPLLHRDVLRSRTLVKFPLVSWFDGGQWDVWASLLFSVYFRRFTFLVNIPIRSLVRRTDSLRCIVVLCFVASFCLGEMCSVAYFCSILSDLLVLYAANEDLARKMIDCEIERRRGSENVTEHRSKMVC